MRIEGIFSRLLLFSVMLTNFPDCAQSQKNGFPQDKTPINNRIALKAQRMLDVASGTIVNDAVVLIEGEKITAAGSRLAIPAETKTIELGDTTLLPGLIDAHTHITYHFDETGHFTGRGDRSAAETLKYAEENARRTLDAGITTIRNLGDGLGVDIVLRDKIKRGAAAGPRIVASGEPLTSYDVRGAYKQADRIERIRLFVRARVAEGADVVKIFEGVNYNGKPEFSAEEIRAAVDEAGRAGLKVAVHAHEAEAVKAAVEGGCASVEHGTFLDDEAIRLLVKNKTALVPTLYLPTHYLERKKQFLFDDSTWEFFETLKARNQPNFQRAKKAGVWLVAGSDAVAGLHGTNEREIIWMTKAGMTPAAALRAGTVDAARLLGLENQIGEVKAGKFADIIAVAGNPLNDISTLERVEFVMKSGSIVKTSQQ